MEETLAITREDLQWAITSGFMADEQAEQLWNHLQFRHAAYRPRLSSSNVAYYMGATIVIIGMAWLLGRAWSEEWGGIAVFLISASYIGAFAFAGHHLWHRPQRKIPGGLLVTIAVLVVPIAVYGFQLMIGLWYRPPGETNYDPFFVDHSIKELLNFLPMEIGLIAAAGIAIWFIPFPFLRVIPAFVLWYMAIDWTESLWGQDYSKWYHQAPFWASIAYGVLCLSLAYWIDKLRSSPSREQQYIWGDFTFWIYFVGVFSFWFGLVYLDIETEWGRLIRCLINIGLIVLSVLLKRRVFIIFGAIGVAMYLFHLSDVFSDWVVFPFAITALGAAVIGFGLYRNKVANDEMTRMLQDDRIGTIPLNESFLPEGGEELGEEVTPEGADAPQEEGADAPQEEGAGVPQEGAEVSQGEGSTAVDQINNV